MENILESPISNAGTVNSPRGSVASWDWSQFSQLDELIFLLLFWLKAGCKERPALNAHVGYEQSLAPSPRPPAACRHLAGPAWPRGYTWNGFGDSRQIPSSNLIYAATKPIGHQRYERVTKYSTWIIFSRCLTGWKQVRLYEAFISLLGSVSDYTDIAQRPWERAEWTTASSFHDEMQEGLRAGQGLPRSQCPSEGPWFSGEGCWVFLKNQSPLGCPKLKT